MTTAKKHRVLLVDDEPNLLDSLRRTLRKEPYEIVCATSAEEALRLLREMAIDVVVSDQHMAGMPGTVFLATVRQCYPETIRFILTGNATLDTAIEAINDGAVSRFFTKPCNPIDLAVTIRQVLQHKALAEVARRLLQTVKRQNAVLASLEEENPGITRVHRDDDGRILLDETPDGLEEWLDEIQGAVVEKGR